MTPAESSQPFQRPAIDGRRESIEEQVPRKRHGGATHTDSRIYHIANRNQRACLLSPAPLASLEDYAVVQRTLNR